MTDIIILALLGVALAAALVKIIKQRKAGGGGCGCSSCSMQGTCGKK